VSLFFTINTHISKVHTMGFFTNSMGQKLTLNAYNAKKGVWIHTTEAKQASRAKKLVEG